MEKIAEKCTIKALTEQDEIVEGYLILYSGKEYITLANDGELFQGINPYSICRNTGVKDKSGKYLYEFDLIQYKDFNRTTKLAIIVFDDFNNSWAVKPNANYSSIGELRKCIEITAIGNVILSDADADKFQAYSDKEDSAYNGIPAESECRSTQAINKLNREFLPKSE